MNTPTDVIAAPATTTVSELRKLLEVECKVFNRNLGRLMVLIYSLDFLNESTDTAKVYGAVNLLQTLLSTLNRGIVTIGVSNNQKSPDALSPEQVMESTPYVSIITALGLGTLGIIVSEGVIPYIIPGANTESARFTLRLYSTAIPFGVAMLNVPSALLVSSPNKSDLPIFLRELLSGGLANMLYFLAFKQYSPQSFIYSVIVHTMSSIFFGRFFMGKFGDMNLRHFFQNLSNKFKAAWTILSAGATEGLLSGVDVLGWMTISWVMSQQEDPRYLLNQLAQITFTSAMVDSLIPVFRKETPSLGLLLSANTTTLITGASLGSLLSLIKKADPAPSLYTLTLLPLTGRRVLSQLAMDKSQDPIATNRKIARSNLGITLLAVGFIFAGFYSGLSSEHIFLFYPLIVSSLSILISLYYLGHKQTPEPNNMAPVQTMLTTTNSARPSAIGFFSPATQRTTPEIELVAEKEEEKKEAIAAENLGLEMV